MVPESERIKLEGEAQAYDAINHAYNELCNPSVVNFNNLVGKNGYLKAPKIFCVTCGEKIVFPPGHNMDGAYSCNSCGSTFAFPVISSVYTEDSAVAKFCPICGHSLNVGKTCPNSRCPAAGKTVDLAMEQFEPKNCPNCGAFLTASGSCAKCGPFPSGHKTGKLSNESNKDLAVPPGDRWKLGHNGGKLSNGK